MKILVIGGMHGNEMLGIYIVNELKNNPIRYVTGIIANEKATNAVRRFTGQDLNRSFPGDKMGVLYEQKRAAKIIEICKDYEVVIDFHNTHCPDNDCSFIGDSASDNLLKVSTLLGLNRVILADYDCLNKYAPNCISIEISLDSAQNDVKLWKDRIEFLAKLVNSELPKPKVEKYRFIYRMTIEDRDKYNLRSKNLQAFVPIDEITSTKLGLQSPAYPIFIDDKFTPYNYGGLLYRI